MKCIYLGGKDVIQHCKKSHLNKARVLSNQSKLSFTAQSNDVFKIIEAELQLAVLTATWTFHWLFMIDFS